MGGLRDRPVLLVEDEFLIAMEMEFSLTDAGGHILGPAKTVAEAMSLIDANLPALAVLDYRLLGGETSLPLAEALDARGVPFLFHTGNATEEELHALHPDAPVLTKPTTTAQLISACEALLED